ncbi:integral membrane protein [Beauveria brongniartii RCEF 3172]|uniref:Integral membrane protein n=1 Tax=Beauveria brongniartii RCEF 3172 TaxID=1081107 RepID=A0A166XXY6_9HYPO|nr:integral membrane protein [Beauveria brongniartii RCEF 3172]
MQDIQNDLPLAMAMAGLSSIAWYIGIEINVSLFILFKRKRGLYFWSCLVASWGVILQPIFMLLADFHVWKDAVPSLVMIYLTWFMMVVPQSWVLYSRLHLLMRATNALQIIKYVLIFNSIVFALPTMVIGTLADIRPLQLHFWSLSSTANNDEPPPKERSPVLRHLIYVNILIIVLDIILLGIQCADLFYLQAALKPCIYGLKLKAEFAILNRLIGILQRRQPLPQGEYDGSAPESAKPFDNPTLFRERAIRDGD